MTFMKAMRATTTLFSTLRYKLLIIQAPHSNKRRFFTSNCGTRVAQAIIERVGAAEAAAQGIRRAERLSREHWTTVYLQQHPGWQGEGCW